MFNKLNHFLYFLFKLQRSLSENVEVSIKNEKNEFIIFYIFYLY